MPESSSKPCPSVQQSNQSPIRKARGELRHPPRRSYFGSNIRIMLSWKSHYKRNPLYTAYIFRARHIMKPPFSGHSICGRRAPPSHFDPVSHLGLPCAKAAHCRDLPEARNLSGRQTMGATRLIECGHFVSEHLGVKDPAGQL